jgi:hypothetical protein
VSQEQKGLYALDRPEECSIRVDVDLCTNVRGGKKSGLLNRVAILAAFHVYKPRLEKRPFKRAQLRCLYKAIRVLLFCTLTAVNMRPFTLLAAAGLASCSALVEHVRQVPSGWKKLEDGPEPSQRLRLSIALREPNMAGLGRKIAERKYLSAQEAQKLRVPDKEDVDVVQKWLKSHGIEHIDQKDDWIHIRTTVEEAEQLLDMKLEKYAFDDREPVTRTLKYSVPDEVRDAIIFVHPVANFMPPRKELSRPSAPMQKMAKRATPCAEETTPECIRKLYNFPQVNTDTSCKKVRLGVAGFLEEFANYKDFEIFLNSSAPDIAATGYNFSVELVNGGENPQDPSKAGAEAALDMQYAMSLAYPAEVTYYSTGGRGEKLDPDGNPYADELVDNEPYLEFLEYMLEKSDDEIPHVLSFSYADDELSVPRPYAERVCNMFGLLTARGTSVLGGSGDGGARGARDSSCRSPEGEDVTMAVFPATCPWVTAVGAVTNFHDPPRGAALSGGGFSQYFPRESWQDDAVEGYVEALGDHLQGYYNGSMRATPDISAVGTSFKVLIGLMPQHLDGTSASTPLLAAVIALINDARLKAGKDVLGWLNGHLYSKEVRAVFQDVKEGTSRPCIFGGGDYIGGWPAAEGWDAITGLGIPNDVEALQQALMNVD